MESEKINVPSSENNSANLSLEKEKDSAGTELIPPKETSPSSESSLTKIHDPVEESIEKKSSTNYQTDNTEPSVSFAFSAERLAESFCKDGTIIFSDSNMFVYTSDTVGSVLSV